MRKYDTYKDSGIEWIGEIPSHWILNKVKHNFSFKTGFTPPSGKTEYYENGTHVWINISDLQEKEVHDSVNKITDKALEDYKPEIIPKGSLLYSFKLSVGRVGFNTVDCYTNEAIFSIDPNGSANLNFFYYSLPEQIIKNANENIYGAKILNQELIKNAFLVAPPPEEQTAIANYLDRKTAEIDELIADKKRLLELYEEEKTAIINQAVTKGINPDVPMKDSGIEWLGEIPEHWEVKRLKYVAKINPTKKAKYKDSDDLVTFLPMEKVGENGTYDCNIKKPISDLWNGFTYFEKGDILVAKITPCFENGKSALLNDLESQIGFGSTEFHVLRAENIQSNFLYYITRSSLFMELGEAFMTGAAGQKRVPTNFISEFELCLPNTIEEQQSIVHYIETETARIDSKKSKTEKLIELLTEYRTALISEVVTGKIKVIE